MVGQRRAREALLGSGEKRLQVLANDLVPSAQLGPASLVPGRTAGKGEHNRLFREKYGLHRLFLHATKIRLPHPRTGATVDIVAPLAEELERLSVALRADGPARRPAP